MMFKSAILCIPISIVFFAFAILMSKLKPDREASFIEQLGALSMMACLGSLLCVIIFSLIGVFDLLFNIIF